MKKLISFATAILIAATLLAGCSQKSASDPRGEASPETAQPSTAEPAPSPESSPNTASTQAGKKTLPKGNWKIGLANGYMGNTWRAQYVEAFEEKAKELKANGIIGDYMIASTNTDVTEQLNQVNNMISSGVDAICINIISPASVVPIIELCKEADVLLVIATDPAGVDGDLVEVLVDNEDFFEIMTKWFVETMDGKGNIVHITGTPGMPATLVRQQVASAILAQYPGIKVLGTAPGSWSQTESQAAMATFLSTFDEIDGVLTEDVMAEGIIRAYETAGKPLPIMTGDYVMSFFRKWETMPELDACATTFQAQGSADALSYAVRVLNGWKLKDEYLVENPLDKSMKNVINIPPSYCITREKPTGNEEWVKGYELTKFISLEEALELGKDLADTAALGNYLSDEQWNEMFE